MAHFGYDIYLCPIFLPMTTLVTNSQYLWEEYIMGGTNT